MGVYFWPVGGSKKVLFRGPSGEKKVAFDEACCCDVVYVCEDCYGSVSTVIGVNDPRRPDRSGLDAWEQAAPLNPLGVCNENSGVPQREWLEGHLLSDGEPPVNMRENARRCHRLFVWENINHNGAEFTDVSTPVILKTNNFAARMTPVATRNPFLSSFNAVWPGGGPIGDPLNEKPYWFEACQVGGWEIIGSHWWSPSLLNLYSCVLHLLPPIGTPFTVLCLVKYHSRRFYSDGTPYLESDGYGYVRTVWINCSEEA